MKKVIPLLALICSCFSCSPPKSLEHELNVQQNMLNAEIGERLKQEGIWVEYAQDELKNRLIKHVGLILVTNSSKFDNKNEAKSYGTRVKDIILELVNSPPFRKYLSNYPFTENQLAFSIRFENKDGSLVGPPYFSKIGFRKNEIYYEIGNKKL